MTYSSLLVSICSQTLEQDKNVHMVCG